MNNCIILNKGDFPVTGLILEYGSTISSLEFNGFTVQDGAGTSFATARNLINTVSGSVGQLILNAVDSSTITAPYPRGSLALGLVSGGWRTSNRMEVSDNVMANNVPYISASTQQPSIKIDGMVESYTGA